MIPSANAGSQLQSRNRLGIGVECCQCELGEVDSRERSIVEKFEMGREANCAMRRTREAVGKHRSAWLRFFLCDLLAKIFSAPGSRWIFRGPLLLGASRSSFRRIALDFPRLWDETLISNQCNHKETRDRQARENVPSLVAQPTHARADFTSVREKSCPLNKSGSPLDFASA
jgi:hypothetical protein